MDLEDIILSEVTQSQKKSLDMHSLISGYQPRNLGYPRYKIQFAKLMKLKKNEDQSVDIYPFLELGTKHPWKKLQRQSLELRQKDGPSRDCPTWGSIPYSVTKHRHYCICQQYYAEKTLIQLSFVRLCQCLANTEVDALIVIYRMDHRAPNGGGRKKCGFLHY